MWMMEWEEMVVENWNDVAKGGVTPPIQGIREARAHSGKEPHGARPTAAPSWPAAGRWLCRCCGCGWSVAPRPRVADTWLDAVAAGLQRARRHALSRSVACSLQEPAGPTGETQRPHRRTARFCRALARQRHGTRALICCKLRCVCHSQAATNQKGGGQQTFHRISQVPLVPHLSPWGPSCCTVCFSGVSLSPEVQARCFN